MIFFLEGSGSTEYMSPSENTSYIEHLTHSELGILHLQPNTRKTFNTQFTSTICRPFRKMGPHPHLCKSAHYGLCVIMHIMHYYASEDTVPFFETVEATA